MDAGRLKNRISIQRREKVQKPSGQIVGEWVDVATVWADVKCTDSKTATEEGVVIHEGLFRFRIRWRPDLRADMRILWAGRTFELTGPPVDWESERVGLTLLARELSTHE